MHSFISIFPLNWSEKFLKLKKVQNLTEENWDQKAIQSLVKKMKAQPETLAILEKILEKQTADTPCITIKRTQDGRIQIDHRKIFPHVAYCKVWRWPDLKNHNELKPINEHCKKSFYLKLNEVCINPYHYERVQSSLCAAASFNQNSFSISNSSFSSSFNDQSLNQFYYSQAESPSVADISTDHNSNALSNNQENYFCNSPNQSDSQSIYATSDVQMFDDSLMNNQIQINTSTNFQSSIETFQTSCCSKTSKWCSIVFHEYNERLGSKAITSNQQVISGLDLPKYLAFNQGIEIHNKDGAVFLSSNCIIYIQCPFLNLLNNKDLKSIEKLEPAGSAITVKIFDENLFEQWIRDEFPKGFVALQDLIKFSKFNLSFFFGWSKQTEILQRPCWLEISMDRALSVLDEPLSKLGSPNQQATSVS